MDSTAHTRYNAEDRSYFSILKREIHSAVLNAGFTPARTGEVDIVVAEMTSNLLKHGGGGEVLFRMFSEDDNIGAEIISIDSGPGMADTAKMMEDGMSTANTLGHGFGAMKRLSDVFEVYSLKNWGTIVLARIYRTERAVASKRPRIEVGSIVVAKPSETLSGDGFYSHEDKDHLKVFLGDGLGHGPEAHKAVQQAITAFKDCTETRPTDILRHIHTAVKKTRGLVGSVAIYYFKEKVWRICGIGNIATRTQNGMTSKNYISYNGIIGMNIPNTLNEQVIENERGQLMIMCSDGIRTRWDLQKYTGILRCDLSIIAAAVYKDHARRTDDMSVVVSRVNTIA